MFQVGGPGGLQGCGDGALRSARHQVGGPGGLQGCEDGVLRSARHQIGGPGGLQGCEDGVLRSARHQVGGPGVSARFRDGALWSTRHQIGGLVGLQGSGMVLYGLPAIRSVALVGLQGCGDSALRSTRHQVGVVPGPVRLWDGVLLAARHQIGVAPGPAWFRGSNKTGALQITILRHWGNKKGCDPLGQHTLYQPNYNNPKTEKWGLSSRTAHPFKPYKKYCIRCPH